MGPRENLRIATQQIPARLIALRIHDRLGPDDPALPLRREHQTLHGAATTASTEAPGFKRPDLYACAVESFTAILGDEARPDSRRTARGRVLTRSSLATARLIRRARRWAYPIRSMLTSSQRAARCSATRERAGTTATTARGARFPSEFSRRRVTRAPGRDPEAEAVIPVQLGKHQLRMRNPLEMTGGRGMNASRSVNSRIFYPEFPSRPSPSCRAIPLAARHTAERAHPQAPARTVQADHVAHQNPRACYTIEYSALRQIPTRGGRTYPQTDWLWKRTFVTTLPANLPTCGTVPDYAPAGGERPEWEIASRWSQRGPLGGATARVILPGSQYATSHNVYYVNFDITLEF